jgi:thiol-disulfide isomerase/thioredoxin
MRRILVLLTLAILCGCGVTSQTSAPESVRTEGPVALVGHPLPEFSLESADGPVTSADLKGKVLLIDFWGVQCPPCAASAPTVERFHREFSDEGLVVLGVNVQNDPGMINWYTKEHGYTYRMCWHSTEFKRACGLQTIPTFLVVDRQGIVRACFLGANDLESNLLKAIRPLLHP